MIRAFLSALEERKKTGEAMSDYAEREDLHHANMRLESQLAEAQRQADITRGQGDAEKNRIFAEAFGRDPDFFAFYRSLLAYEQSFRSGETRMVLSPESEFMRFFKMPFASAPSGGFE